MKLIKLEAIRASAALYVFAGHFLFAWYFAKDSLTARSFLLGQEAVMVFFVLSGFVIYLSTSTKPDISFRDYFKKRFLRIYPIFVLALSVAFAMGCLHSVDDALAKFRSAELMGNLLMLQDFKWAKNGVWFSTFFGNAPLWSLSYEWWFYMAFFPVYRLIASQRRIHWVGVGSLISGILYNIVPNQPCLFAAYFVTWWAGVEIAREFLEHRTVTFRRQLPSLSYLLASVIFWSAIAIWQKNQAEKLSLGAFPILPLRHFAACIAVVVVTIICPSILGQSSNRFVHGLARLGGISYALYIVHFPIACTYRWLSWLNIPALEFSLYIAFTFVVAYFAENVFSRSISRRFAGAKPVDQRSSIH